MLNFEGKLVERKKNDHTIFAVKEAPNDAQNVDCADRSISKVLTSICENYCLEKFAFNLNPSRYDISSVRSGRHKGVTARELSALWKISPKLAQKTIDATTQLCIRTADIPSLS